MTFGIGTRREEQKKKVAIDANRTYRVMRSICICYLTLVRFEVFVRSHFHEHPSSAEQSVSQEMENRKRQIDT